MKETLKLAANYGFPMVISVCTGQVGAGDQGLQRSIMLLTMVVARQSDIDIAQMQKIMEGKF